MNFWRGEAYTQFFEYLDSHGGFYYEVRTISLSITYSSTHSWFANVHSGGEMPLSAASQHQFSREKTRFISLKISGTNVRLIRIVRRVRIRGRGTVVRAIRRRVLVSTKKLFTLASEVHIALDYDGYSCLKKWESAWSWCPISFHSLRQWLFGSLY